MVGRCFVAIVLALVQYASSTINKDVQRTIDASTSILKVYTDIKAADIDKEYMLVFPTYQAKNLAFLSVTQKGKSLIIAAPVS
jgi:dihydroxyacetone kinase